MWRFTSSCHKSGREDSVSGNRQNWRRTSASWPHFWHPLEDIGSRLASGSSAMDAMVVAPCSIHTMSAIATGISSNLLVRAADVILKEKRKLILLVRESPFHLGHLRNMTALAEMGAIIAPPIPGFLPPSGNRDGYGRSQRGPGFGPAGPAGSGSTALGGGAEMKRKPLGARLPSRARAGLSAKRRRASWWGRNVRFCPASASKMSSAA